MSRTKTNQPKPLGRVMWGYPDSIDAGHGALTVTRCFSDETPHLVIPMTGPQAACNRAAVVEEMAKAEYSRDSLALGYNPQWETEYQNVKQRPIAAANTMLAALGWPETKEPKKRRAKR